MLAYPVPTVTAANHLPIRPIAELQNQKFRGSGKTRTLTYSDTETTPAWPYGFTLLEMTTHKDTHGCTCLVLQTDS
jgi:hypothetical protein